MHCHHDLGPAGQSWKQNARLSSQPVCELPGAGSGANSAVLLRRFACPGCATLLDSEVALPDDPFLDDIVLG
jgi:acetone carboxylase gamma subunit